jgi:antitoxin (DNA-binding transcriptional repressor) of toxin-antitoxin stability system
MRLVKAGETVEITERGKVIGRIVPAEPSDDVRARLLSQGRLTPATGDRKAFLASVSSRFATEPVDRENSATATLLAMRDDETY